MINLCIKLMGVAVIFQIFDGVQVTVAGALRGAGFTKIPLFSALISHWGIGLPLGLYFAFYRDLEVLGLWWGLSSGLICASILLTSAFFWCTRARGV